MRQAAAGWLRAGAIDAATRDKIVAAYPDDRSRLGPVFRVLVFGFTIGITATYKGFTATNGTEGVGRAANAAVVFSMFAIFIEEVIIVQIIGWIRSW